jgi:hypothetical protein
VRCTAVCGAGAVCGVRGASHFQGMLNKKHKQPRARSAEPARAAETAAPGAGASPVPRGYRPRPPVRRPGSAVVGCALPSPVYGQCGGRASLTLYKWLQTSANLGNVRPVTSASVPRPLSESLDCGRVKRRETVTLRRVGRCRAVTGLTRGRLGSQFSGIRVDLTRPSVRCCAR